MNTDAPEETSVDPEELVARLSAVPEMRQRSYALASRLCDLANHVVVMVINFIREKAILGDENYLRLYNGLLCSDTLELVLGRGRMSELVDAARELGEYQVVALLMDPPHEGDGDTPFQPYLEATLRDAPLGVRKAMARKPDFKIIKRIAKDQDHRVIRNLLNNPKLTEYDVTVIASTRPTSPMVIREIFNHHKWITRYPVKKVIVLNPHTPLSIALKLLVFMSAQDLHEVRQGPDLDPIIIREAQRIAEKKTEVQLVKELHPPEAEHEN